MYALGENCAREIDLVCTRITYQATGDAGSINRTFSYICLDIYKNDDKWNGSSPIIMLLSNGTTALQHSSGIDSAVL